MQSKIHTLFFEDTAALFALASDEDMYVGVLSNQSPASLLESGGVRRCQDGDGWCQPDFTQASQRPFRNLWVTSRWLCPLFVTFFITVNGLNVLVHQMCCIKFRNS